MSAVPAAIDALVAATQTALPSTQVFDGPPTDDEQNERVFIGWNRSRPVTDVFTDDPVTFDSAVTERFTIPCTAVSWSGDIGVKARRDRAFAMVQAINDALPASTGMKTINADARVTVAAYTPEQTSVGTQVLVDFTVHVEAFS